MAPDDLLAYLAASTSPYHAVAEAAARLDVAGFRRLDPAEPWSGRTTGAAYTSSGGALVAWREPAGAQPARSFRVLGAHTDSPVLKLKPRPDQASSGWRHLAVEVYGGALLNSWFDRDLGLSGRVVLADGTVRLLQVAEPVARVPQLAIHLDRDVNERGLVLDKQVHLVPVTGLGERDQGGLVRFAAGRLGVDAASVATFDLVLHDLTPPAHLGLGRELLAAGRLDNLCSCWCAVRSLLDAGDGPATPVVALFDHEEVGSESATGAAGPLLATVLGRLLAERGAGDDERARALHTSLCVSADMAHAVHPGYPERHEPGHAPLPNRGPVLKVNANQRYATDAPTAAAFLAACERAGVPHQVFVSRNSMPCGSTIGPITATRLGIPTVDVGCAQLSMHSARELMGADDPALFVAALREVLSA